MPDWKLVSEHRNQASLTYGLADKWRQTKEGEGEEVQAHSQADRSVMFRSGRCRHSRRPVRTHRARCSIYVNVAVWRVAYAPACDWNGSLEGPRETWDFGCLGQLLVSMCARGWRCRSVGSWQLFEQSESSVLECHESRQASPH